MCLNWENEERVILPCIFMCENKSRKYEGHSKKRFTRLILIIEQWRRYMKSIFFLFFVFYKKKRNKKVDNANKNISEHDNIAQLSLWQTRTFGKLGFSWSPNQSSGILWCDWSLENFYPRKSTLLKTIWITNQFFKKIIFKTICN